MKSYTLLEGEDFKNQVLTRMGDKPYQWASQHGIGRRVIDSIKKGKIPDPRNLVPLANALMVSIDWLLTGKNVHGDEGFFVKESAVEYIPKNTEEEEILDLYREANQEIRNAARAVLESSVLKKKKKSAEKT
jgi:hypothetical protein